MTARRHPIAALLGGAALLFALPADFAASQAGMRQTSSYTLTEKRPDRSTAERFRFDYVNPDDPDGKPRAVRRVVTLLPHTARYDPTAPGSCTASDEELTARGAEACPADSVIGGGVVTIDTGLPGSARIVTADVSSGVHHCLRAVRRKAPRVAPSTPLAARLAAQISQLVCPATGSTPPTGARNPIAP